MSFNHKELCELGAKWLASGRHHQCKAILIEPATCDERPDVIGFRYYTPPFGSVVLEAKTSRADFLTDMKKKEHRKEGKGMGKWRYFICPKDLIKPFEIPEKWGLLYVSPTGRIKCVKGAMESTQYMDVCNNLEKYCFQDRDIESELRILGSNLQFRMANENEGITYKELYNRNADLRGQLAEVKARNDLLTRENEQLIKQKAKAEDDFNFQKSILGMKQGEVQTLNEHIERTQSDREY